MKVKIKPGKYVLAVSGGVDSMSLLHLLVQKSQSSVISHQSSVKKTSDYRLGTRDSTSLQLVVAHFNHGIRGDSSKDERLVKTAAKKYDLLLEVEHGRLGAGASEAKARAARYGFLEKVRSKHRARAIITAHHQDDLIETAILNLQRGSGRRGLSAIADNPRILRPLLDVPKREILDYAKKHNLRWREDSTNLDPKYRRSYVRLNIMSNLTPAQRTKILNLLSIARKSNREIESELEILSAAIKPSDEINRLAFVSLPAAPAAELVVYWLRQIGISDLDKPTAERLANAIKTAKAASRHDVRGNLKLMVSQNTAKFEGL